MIYSHSMVSRPPTGSISFIINLIHKKIHARTATGLIDFAKTSKGVLYPRRLRGRLIRRHSIWATSTSLTVIADELSRWPSTYPRFARGSVWSESQNNGYGTSLPPMWPPLRQLCGHSPVRADGRSAHPPRQHAASPIQKPRQPCAT